MNGSTTLRSEKRRLRGAMNEEAARKLDLLTERATADTIQPINMLPRINVIGSIYHNAERRAQAEVKIPTDDEYSCPLGREADKYSFS